MPFCSPTQGTVLQQGSQSPPGMEAGGSLGLGSHSPLRALPGPGAPQGAGTVPIPAHVLSHNHIVSGGTYLWSGHIRNKSFQWKTQIFIFKGLKNHTDSSEARSCS